MYFRLSISIIQQIIKSIISNLHYISIAQEKRILEKYEPTCPAQNIVSTCFILNELIFDKLKLIVYTITIQLDCNIIHFPSSSFQMSSEPGGIGLFSDIFLFSMCLILTGILIFILIYFIITLSDLECDYLNAEECCGKLNFVSILNIVPIKPQKNIYKSII